MRVLITGAGGFIGRHLVEDQLQRSRQVTAVDLDTSGLAPSRGRPGLAIVEGDFRDRALLDRTLSDHDVCFHLASLHLQTDVDESAFWAVNVQGARQLVERCHAAGVGRFVHCSSVGVYGDVKTPPADEESQCDPDIPYERSKLAGETAVREYAVQTGYPVVVVRPSWVYGPGCPRTTRLFRAILKGRFFYVGSGKTLRHPIFIEDFLAGLELAASRPSSPGQVFILAGPRAVTIQELVEAIAFRLGKPAPRLRLPRVPVLLAAFAVEKAHAVLKKPSPLSRRSLKFYTGNTAFTTQRAQTVLGFKPKIELDEGLARTGAWLQESGLI
jgi:nucleoside-diphosphate-sugar epimerase